jgi:uncharacterized membrane protein YhaH (DUF805 family)
MVLGGGVINVKYEGKTTVNFFDAVKICFVKYTNFSDRASRSEFWLFALFVFIMSILCSFLDPWIAGESFLEYDEVFGPLSIILSVATLIPSFSVSVRRLHDVNRSGWWLLIELTIIGMIFPILYWCCKKGDEGENRFGPKPLQ